VRWLIKKKTVYKNNIKKEVYSVQFRVTKIKDLINVIIPNFDSYPLLTQKKADFILFKQVVLMMDRKEHLTIEGLQKIVAIRGSINWGASDKLKEAFPDILPVKRPLVKLPKSFDPNWITAFAAGEGSFFASLTKVKKKLGWQIHLVFKIGQHSRDKMLLDSLVSYFWLWTSKPSQWNSSRI